MATTADIKIGACIELEGKTFQIVDFQHVKPGKGPAFVRTPLTLFSPSQPLPYAAGDRIRFVPIGEGEFEAIRRKEEARVHGA